MFECGMAGCFNIAKYEAKFDADGEEEIFDICQSCANYWKRHLEERPTITRHKNKERELAK
jgi:hypothetical protein